MRPEVNFCLMPFIIIHVEHLSQLWSFNCCVTIQVQGKVFPPQQSRAYGTGLQAKEEWSNQPIVGGKLKAAVVNNQPADATQKAVIEWIAGRCPNMNMMIEGQEVEAVIDRGSEISTVTESWCLHYLGKWPLQQLSWLSVSAAYRLHILYIVLLEENVQVFSWRC